MNSTVVKRALPVFDSKVICGVCESSNIETYTVDTKFPFKKDNTTVELVAHIPCHECRDCGFEFLTSKGEELCHDAVCDYLKLMKPSQIKKLRKKLDMSVSEFSELTGIGTASLTRWENGAVIQSKAMDNLLYLNQFESNRSLLAERDCPHKHESLKSIFIFVTESACVASRNFQFC